MRVTRSVCSNWALSEPSAVRTVHLSFGSTSTSQPPRLTIGSIVNVMPDSKPLKRTSLAVVLDLGRFVKLSANPVAHKVADDAAALALDVLLDGGPDVSEASPVANLGDANIERPSRHFDDVPSFWARGADVKRGAGVAVKTIEDVGDIDVDDVAALERSPVGDSVAHDLVDARANALWIALVVERSRSCALSEGVFVDNPVNFVGRHSTANLVADQQEGFGREAANRAHQLDFFGALDVDRHGSHLDQLS